jgi:acetyl-CoA acetyltransferase
MKQQAYIAGVGMTAFGKFPGVGLKSLAEEAIRAAVQDAGIDATEIQAAYVGNAAAGAITGQLMVRGQVILRSMGLGGIPVVNVENACATSATAFEQAAAMVTLGRYDCVLVTGVEKLYSPDKQRSLAVFDGAVDVEAMQDLQRWVEVGRVPQDAAFDAPRSRSLFMDIYARVARDYARRSGATAADFARVSAKASVFGSLNPKAQYRDRLSVEEVLQARLVSEPLTLPMCCPMGDGAAALVLMSEQRARQHGLQRCVRVLSSVLASGWDRDDDAQDDLVSRAAAQAYEEAGVGPNDVDVVELHDAAAPAELVCCEQLGLCARDEGPAFIRSGATSLGGTVPVNPSGGLLRKGHPIGASGCAQLVELASQLRGECGERQTPGARIALAENGGGWIGSDPATVVVTLLGSAT